MRQISAPLSLGAVSPRINASPAFSYPEALALILSLVLHAGLTVVALSFLVAVPRPAEPVLIDLTLDPLPSEKDNPGRHKVENPHPARRQQAAAPAARTTTVSQVSAPAIRLLNPVTQPVHEKTAAVVETVPSAPHTEPVREATPTVGGSFNATGTLRGGISSSSPGNGQVSAIMDGGGYGASSNGNRENHELLANRYLKEHFTYIRDLIAGRLVYPNVAVRMGWSGRVAVSFVIREDGEVEELRIAKSSGYPMLDADAVNTVRKSAPFPKPPVRARLVVSVEYILN